MMNSMVTGSDEEFIDIDTVEDEENAACTLKRLINDAEKSDSGISISRNSSLDQSTRLSDHVNVLDLLTKLQNVKVVLKRLSTIEILKYTKKPDPDFDATDKKYLQHFELNHTNSTKKLLNSDVQVDENVKSPCRFCHKELAIINHGKKHEYYCGREPDFFCEFCPYETQFKVNLKSHLSKNRCRITCEAKASSETHKTSNKDAFNGTDQISSTIKWHCFNCHKTTVIEDISSDLVTCSKCNTKLNFQCTQCKEQFGNRERAIRHSKFGCSKEQARCPECPFVTSAISLFYFHMNDKHPLKPRKPVCGTCLNQFQSILYLKRHWKACAKLKSMNTMFCDRCEFYTTSKKILTAHLIQHRNEDKRTCSICGKKCKGVPELERHLLICEKELQQCKLCPYKTKYSRNMARHLIVRHHSIESNEAQRKPTPNLCSYCVNCDKKVAVGEEIRIDGITCCRICKAKCHWQCIRCNQADKSYGKWKCQAKYCYNSTNKHHCTYCDYVTPRKYDLERHISQKHITVDQNNFFKCPECGTSYRLYRYLENHIRRCHKKGRLRLGHRFKNDKQISKTRRAPISNAKILKFLKNSSNCFTCTCGKVFAQAENLRMHKKICETSIKMQEDLASKAN